MPWSTPFDDPIPLPNRGKLLTLKDAGAYITKLPKAEQCAAPSLINRRDAQMK